MYSAFAALICACCPNAHLFMWKTNVQLLYVNAVESMFAIGDCSILLSISVFSGVTSAVFCFLRPVRSGISMSLSGS